MFVFTWQSKCYVRHCEGLGQEDRHDDDGVIRVVRDGGDRGGGGGGELHC